MSHKFSGRFVIPNEEISKDDADKLQDYAQDLEEEITHVVDYGKIKED